MIPTKMAYTEEIKAELRNEATNIWLRIIDGIEQAVESDQEVSYVRDMIIMGDKMTYMMKRENWVEHLDKARLYFEDMEDYDACKRCRDLKRKIANITVIPMPV